LCQNYLADQDGFGTGDDLDQGCIIEGVLDPQNYGTYPHFPFCLIPKSWLSCWLVHHMAAVLSNAVCKLLVMFTTLIWHYLCCCCCPECQLCQTSLAYLYILNAVRYPFVRLSVMLGVASSVAN